MLASPTRVLSREKQPRYLSYLLRLWQVQENEHTTWRASLESSHTGEKWGFADLDALCVFLHEQTTILADSDRPDRFSETCQV